MSLAIVFIILELIVIVLVLVYTCITGISPVPTSPKVKKVILDVIPSDLEGPVLELGSGWGTMAFALARQLPKSQIIAYEISPVPWLFSRIRLLFSPLPNLIILRQDFHKASFRDAILVICYLFNRGMAELKPKFEKELKPGTVIISNTFHVPGWQPVAVYHADDLYATKIFAYKFPPEKSIAEVEEEFSPFGYEAFI